MAGNDSAGIITIELNDPGYWVRVYASLYVAPMVSMSGIGLNLYAIWFLSRRRTVSSVYLRLLMLTDLLQLTLGLSYGIFYACRMAIGDRNRSLMPACLTYSRLVRPVTARLITLSDTIHLWVVTALTAHRYWKVSKPILAHVHDTKPFACCVLMGLVFAAFIYRLPTIWELKLVLVQTSDNATYYIFIGSHLNENPAYQIYSVFSNLLLYSIVPYVALIVLDVLILRAIKRAGYDPLLSRSRLRSRERRAAVSVVLIGCVFLLFHALRISAVTRKLVRYFQNVPIYQSPIDYRMTFDICNLLMMFCSAVNPIIYINTESMFSICRRPGCVDESQEHVAHQTEIEMEASDQPTGNFRYERQPWPRGLSCSGRSLKTIPEPPRGEESE